MDSRRGSTVATGRRSSATNAHYQRQASLSLQLEQGRLNRRLPPRSPEIRQLGLDDYFIGKKSEIPKTLSRADTGLCPLEEITEQRTKPLQDHHPGEKWHGQGTSETLNEIEASEHHPKPWQEPNSAIEADINKHWLDSHKLVKNDAEAAHPRLQRIATEAQYGSNFFTSSIRKIFRRPAIQQGAISGLGFVASLPTAHANAVLHHVDGPAELHRAIYILDYKHDNAVLRCGPPKPFDSVGSLKHHLNNSDNICDLRLIYTCNNEEAVDLLSHDFGISSSGVESGERSLRDWMQTRRFSRRATGKTIKWRPSYDGARGLICSAFALDFGKVLVAKALPGDPLHRKGHSARLGLMESTYRQRISVYIQRKATSEAPGAKTLRFHTGSKRLPAYAASPTIIISEYSAAGIDEVVATAPLLGLDVVGDVLPTVVTKGMQDIMSHVVEGIHRLWYQQVHLLHEPHAELEDYIWAQPSDSSRAREIWSMWQRLHEILKLINRHTSLIEDIQDDFRAFAELREDQDWLEPIIEEMRDLSEIIDVDYSQPMERMIDLMYKSVTIRDSRQSLELNASLWRLSWITFIFLPLSALSGFFGMNVGLFKDDPSIKWYFISAVPLLGLVVGFWYSFRTFAPASKQAGLLEFDAPPSLARDDKDPRTSIDPGEAPISSWSWLSRKHGHP